MVKLNSSSIKHCRACLKPLVHQMYSLALHNARIEDRDRIKVEEIELADIYHQCTQLIYEQNDPKWEWICSNCYEKMVDFFKFRLMCIESLKTLQEYGSVFEEKPDNVTVGFKVEVVDVADILQPDDDRFASDDGHFGDEYVEDEEDKTNGDETDETVTELDRDEISFKQSASLNVSMNDDDVEMPQEEEETKKVDEEDIEETNRKTEKNIEQTVKSKKLPKNKKSSKTPLTNPEKYTPAECFPCDKCPSKFFKKHRYDAHLRKHMGLKQWQCEHCDKGFEKYATLKSHISVKHYDESEGKPEFICDVDGCGKIFSSKDSIRSHIQKLHIGKYIKPLPKKMCEQCGKSFANNNALLKHSYTHTKVTPHKCPVCSKMFATNYKLKEHQMRHDGIKNFICPTCGLRKTTGHELRVHMKYHLIDTKFPCELCSLVFTRIANMKRHMKIVHCGIKAFPCPHCDRTFGKAETAKHHIMTHTGERPLACTVCERRFIQPIALKTHMKVHNKIK